MNRAVRVMILGAAGRDFHNFNQFYRSRPEFEVVAFTAAQIPGIDHRVYPASLAGPLYPDGIPIVPEKRMEEWMESLAVGEVNFAYSDVSFEHVMRLASRALAQGADFRLLGPAHTQLRSALPVVAVCASRTGAGKSQTARRVVALLKELGVERVGVLRHPMPYGDLSAQSSQRFACLEDLARADCTLEEREEYEPHLRQGTLVYAGIDYAAILTAAEQECQVLVWDGGNNDFPFLAPDILITVVDPLRDTNLGFFPGEANVRAADVLIINKVDSATPQAVQMVREEMELANPGARLIKADSRLQVDGDRIRGRRVLVVEDGPSLTHGGLAFGAGSLAARRFEASEIMDPRPHAVGSLAQVFQDFPHLGPVLPAMGYSHEQCQDLRLTIEGCRPELVVSGTPIDLARDLGLRIPVVRVFYELAERGPELRDALAPLAAHGLTGHTPSRPVAPSH